MSRIVRKKKTPAGKIAKLIDNEGLAAVLGEVAYYVAQSDRYDSRYNMILASCFNSVNHLTRLIAYEKD
jgi:hypothetical protein